MGPALENARADWGELGEATLDSGLSYGSRKPVEVRVRKRGHRYDISDQGGATAAAGKPAGWLGQAERVVAEVGLNVNRRGVVFVSAVEGRDIASLAMKVAETSLAVYSTLLESQD